MPAGAFLAERHYRLTIGWLRTIQAEGLTALAPKSPTSPLTTLDGKPITIRAAFEPSHLYIHRSTLEHLTGMELRRGFPPTVPKLEENGDDFGKIDEVATADLQARVKNLLAEEVAKYAPIFSDGRANAYHLFDIRPNENESDPHAHVHVQYFSIE